MQKQSGVNNKMKSIFDYVIDIFKNITISKKSLKIEELLSLPINILETILAQFLGICDISSLDIACCNRENRLRLLNVLSDSCISFSNVTLNIKGCDVDSAMIWLGLRKINVQQLSMIGNYNLTNKGLIGLSLNCNKLKSLYIGGINNITDDGLVQLSRCSHNLEVLYIRECNNITDYGIIELTKNCSKLGSLYIAGSRLTDRGLIELAKNLTGILQTLNISECLNVTDIGIIELGNRCNNLESLYVGGCDITDQGVIQLLRVCPSLLTLNINGCNNITDSGIAELNKQNLQSLYVGRK